MTDHLEEQWRTSAQALGLALRRQTWRSHIADNFGAVSAGDDVRDVALGGGSGPYR